MKFNFNEKSRIYNIIEDGNVEGLSENKAIWNAAIYYTQLNPIDKKDIFWKIVSFMQDHYAGFMYQSYVSVINKDINKAYKYRIKDVNLINITKREMDKILSLGDIKKEKIAFVILALAKYQNAESQRDKDTFYAKTSEIFKFARVSIPVKERDLYFGFAYREGILKQNFSIGYNALTAAFVDHEEEEVVLTLDEYDYLELAYAFLNYKNGGYKRCKTCGRWFRVINNSQQYCSICIPPSTYQPEYKGQGDNIFQDAFKKITCIDCGKDVFLESYKNSRSCRCEECYNVYRRSKKTEVMRNLRAKQ